MQLQYNTRRVSIKNEGGTTTTTLRSFGELLCQKSQDRDESSVEMLKLVGKMSDDLVEDEFTKAFLKVPEWPPKPGRTTSCILAWSVAEESMWGGDPEMSEVLPRALGIARMEFGLGDVLRMKSSSPAPRDDSSYGTYYFDEQLLKGVAALLVWCGLLATKD